MSDPKEQSSEMKAVSEHVPPKTSDTMDGINLKPRLYETAEQRLDAIEMIGEEVASGYEPNADSGITPGMRYLHCSRTIHQLVTDRNRSVGLYLAVATLLWTASTALLNVKPNTTHIIPLEVLQRWCLPVSFGIMAILAFLVAFLLIRSRVGLIYEVAKMNVLLGIPAGRVKRVNPLSIFFLMHLMVSLAGGGSAGLFSAYIMRLINPEMNLTLLGWLGFTISAVIAGLLVFLYIWQVKAITSDEKLNLEHKQANQKS